MAAGVDRCDGGKYAWKALNRWEDVKQAYSNWAKKGSLASLQDS